MRGGARGRGPGSLPLLLLLTTWAAVLSVEVWFRLPGTVAAPPLPPQRLDLGGQTYRRGAPLPIREPSIDLASGASAVRRWDVPYDAAAAAIGVPQRFRLIHIQGSGTGRSDRLQVPKIRSWLGDQGRRWGTSGCLVRDPDGRPRLITTTASWDRWQDRRPPRPMAGRWLGWLAGLRPIEQVDCLWLSSGGGPFGARALAQLADQLGAAVPR